MIVKALFQKEEPRLTLTFFDEKLSNIYKEQVNATKPFNELTKHDIMEFLLTVHPTAI